MKLLKPQIQGVTSIRQKLDKGVRRVVLCSPTGGGKTVMAFHMIKEAVEQGRSALLLTHRRMLFDQIDRKLKESGIYPGYRASGAPDYEGQVTLAMIQTEYDRSYKKKKTKPAVADLVIQDECHADKGKRIAAILDHNYENGAEIIGLSATPINVGKLYDDIAYAGKNSDLLECGLHLPLDTFAPNEVDLSDLNMRIGKYAEDDLTRKFATHAVVGSVAQHIRIFNPDLKPGLVYGPSVAGSRFLTDGLNATGIKAAHLDGKNAYWNGREIKSSRSIRDDLVSALIGGKLNVICNRFVLREGIDIPEVYCVSLATRMGLTAYIQSCGRVLRSHPSLDHVSIIDHGGNSRVHGLIDTDREYVLTNPEHKQPSVPDKVKGWRCPKCFCMHKSNGICRNCGTPIETRNFTVLQTDGRLELVTHDDVDVDLKKAVNGYHRFYFAMRTKRAPVTFAKLIELFEQRNPEFRIRIRDKTTHMVHVSSGKSSYLRYIPFPKTEEWKKHVFKVGSKRLQ